MRSVNIGIDAGGSAIKLAGLLDGEVVFTHYEDNGKLSAAELLESVAAKFEAPAKRVFLTGVGAGKCELDKLGASVVKVPEVFAIGAGGTFLAGESDAIIASVGTGTAFVFASGGEYRHLGGTGVGGGTLTGLGRRILGIPDAKKLDELAKSGDLSAVDIIISDLFPGSKTLKPELTAANLAKCNTEASEADWAYGIINMVLQTVGTMCMIAARESGISSVVLTGAMPALDTAAGIFRRFEECYGLRYIIPENARCATAIGAALYGKI